MMQREGANGTERRKPSGAQQNPRTPLDYKEEVTSIR
jgi:hypothetical protein